MLLEKVLEKQLITEIKRLHGWCLKLWSISFTGLPDRMILLPGGKLRFVEVKREGKVPGPRQLWVHDKLRAMGFKVDWIDTKEKLKILIDDL